MEKSLESIERFFNGDMSDEERNEFEKQRSEDRLFDEEVMLYCNTGKVIRFQAQKRMKKQFDAIGKQQTAFDLVSTYVRYRLLQKVRLPVAASIVIVGTLAYFSFHVFYRQSKPDSYLALYQTYYDKPEVEQVITRSSDEDDLSFLWYEALDKYKNSNYRGAAEDFKTLLESHEFSQPSAASFYAGVSYLNLNKPDSAIAFLGNVSPVSSIINDADWYLALGYIKAGKLAEARELLIRISGSEGHPRSKDARKLAKELSKLDVGI